MELSRFRPYHRYDYQNPLTANGFALLAYQWQYETVDDGVDWNGNERVKRVSDWTQAELNSHTNRYIVHQFIVSDSTGKSEMVSAETAMKLLGFEKKIFHGMVNAIHRIEEYREIAEVIKKNKQIVETAYSLPVPEQFDRLADERHKERRGLTHSDLVELGIEDIPISFGDYENILKKYGPYLADFLYKEAPKETMSRFLWRLKKIRDMGYRKVDEKTRKKVEKLLKKAETPKSTQETIKGDANGNWAI
jgi:hypothetical protein